MRIEHGIQPNCSELCIRLEAYTTTQIRERLEEHGIVEMLSYRNQDTEQDWDTDIINPMPLKDVDPTTRKLIQQWHSATEAVEMAQIELKLKKKGLKSWLIDISLGKKDDFKTSEFGAKLWLDKDGPAIMYHQHCQPEGFPLLREISDIFGKLVEANDGGSTTDYDGWLYERPLDMEENYN